MADIICRWRNATPKTVCEFVEKLPSGFKKRAYKGYIKFI